MPPPSAIQTYWSRSSGGVAEADSTLGPIESGAQSSVCEPSLHGPEGAESVEGSGPGDDLFRDCGQLQIVGTRVMPNEIESFGHVDLPKLGHHSVCLLDENAAVQSVLQLKVSDPGLPGA